jgi:hypothetical protein
MFFAKNLLRPIPLVLIVLGTALGVTLGSVAIAISGAGLAIVAAAAASLDPRRRLLHRLARAPGIDTGVLAQARAIRRRLSRLKSRPAVGQEAFRALDQLDACHRGYLALGDVIAERFDTGELTFGRYLGAAREVYLGCLDGIARAATALEAGGGVDAPRLRSELRQLERRAPDDGGHDRVKALRARIDALEASVEDARQTLAANEAALADMSGAAGALSRIETRRGLASADTATGLRELQILTERAALYALPDHSKK